MRNKIKRGVERPNNTPHRLMFPDVNLVYFIIFFFLEYFN